MGAGMVDVGVNVGTKGKGKKEGRGSLAQVDNLEQIQFHVQPI